MLRRLPHAGLAGRYVAVPRAAGALAPINLLTGGIALTAVLLAIAVRSITPPENAVAIPWWILAAAFLAAERFLVHIPSRRTAHTLTFAELPLVMGLFFASPLTLLGSQLLGACVALLIDRHMSGIRRVFNLAQYGLTSGVAILVFDFFHAGGMSVGAWAACLAAVSAASVVGIAAIVAAMTATRDRPTGAKLTYMLLTGLAVSVTNTSLALLAAFVAWNDAMALVLLAVPIMVVFLSYRAYVAQHRHAEQVEFLNLATRDLVASRTVEEGLGRLLEHSLATFHCEFAELVLFSTGPDEAILRLTQWGDERGSLLPVTGLEAARLAPMSRDGSLNEVLRGYLEDRDLGDVLAARLVDENGVLGLLMVGAPSDGGGRLGPAEAKLLDTLAHQAAAVLRYERLEQAFDRLHAEQARFRHAALHDPVTGLGNRRLFGERLGDALGRRRPVAIMLVDLDDFKQVNDTL
ncbi:MAG: hypothetical protein QOJ19_1148, partial [Acidimicrobiia bacterium]|nr:hypothetical protein [Acidimicrobiia bacterium]